MGSWVYDIRGFFRSKKSIYPLQICWKCQGPLLLGNKKFVPLKAADLMVSTQTKCSYYMANIAHEQPSIRDMQVVSSNHVHSTHLCEANKCRIFKPFFCLSDKRFLSIIIKNFFEEDKSQGAFFTAQNCIFWGVRKW